MRLRCCTSHWPCSCSPPRCCSQGVHSVASLPYELGVLRPSAAEVPRASPTGICCEVGAASAADFRCCGALTPVALAAGRGSPALVGVAVASASAGAAASAAALARIGASAGAAVGDCMAAAPFLRRRWLRPERSARRFSSSATSSSSSTCHEQIGGSDRHHISILATFTNRTAHLKLTADRISLLIVD